MDSVLEMRFLVTGSSGLIGSQVVKDLLKQNQTVYSCYHNEESEQGIPINLDLTDHDMIIRTIQETKPDRIIHLAAMTNVDLCETEKEMATLINEDATKTIARQAAKQQIFSVYVSTDYIFDGKDGMKKEHDIPNPLGFYGKSKLAGELALNKFASSYAIARTSTPFGIHKTKNSFPVWVIENLKLKKSIPVLVDQFTSPTYVPNLSSMLIEVATKQITGTIHLAGMTRISRFEFAKMIADRLDLDKTLLKPTMISEMTWNAQRPHDSSLDVSLARELLDEKPQTIQQSLESFLSEL
jgi:dTDP-4-dehydrorhamnose reductase